MTCAHVVGGLRAPKKRRSTKFRQAYLWIVNHAVITPYHDIEPNEQSPRTFRSAA